MRTQVSHRNRGKEEEEEGSDSDSSYSSSSSHEAAEIARKPPQQEAPPKHIPRKDTFFDQPISEHDYSSAIEALSQSKSRDDAESDKPAYSPRQRTFSETSSSSSSGSDTSGSDSEGDTAVLSRKDVGDDGSPRDKQNEKSEKISATEVRVL